MEQICILVNVRKDTSTFYKNEMLGILIPVLLAVSHLPQRSLPNWVRCMQPIQELWT